MSNQTLGDIRRLRAILQVLTEEGFAYLVDAMSLGSVLPTWHRVRGAVKAKTVIAPEVRVRHVAERLGPTFVKFGQILSTRPDILPPEYVTELAKLQDQVPPLARGEAEKAIEAAFGKTVRQLFKTFDTKPLAAASLAQVHVATLKTGEAVAVKVQRPIARATITEDLRLILQLAKLIEERVPTSRRYRPFQLASEFADWTMRELDFAAEAANIERFRQDFAGDETVVVPNVHWDFTCASVLTTDLLTGTRVTDFAGLKRHHIDRVALAKVGLRLGFKQFLVHGHFHGDPHPGNLVALPPLVRGGSPRLGVYDFGIVGHLSERTRFAMVGCFAAMAQKDADGCISHMMDLAESREEADTARFAATTRTILTDIFFRPTRQVRFGEAFYRIMLAGAEQGLRFSRELLIVGKSLVTLENVGLALDPEVDPIAVMRPLLDEVVKREFDPRRLVAEASTTAFDALHFLKQLPEDTRLLMDRLSKGEIGVKIDLQELRDLKLEFDRENDIRVIGVMAAALLLASAWFLSAVGVTPFWRLVGQIGFGCAIALTLLTVLLVLRRPR